MDHKKYLLNWLVIIGSACYTGPPLYELTHTFHTVQVAASLATMYCNRDVFVELYSFNRTP
jgi:hypothetical protein